jgi:hypothetical protein
MIVSGDVAVPNNNIPHLLLFYAFLDGLAQNLTGEVGESFQIDKYRRLSRIRRDKFILSIPNQNELTIAVALASYLEAKSILLDDPSWESQVGVIIDDPSIAEDLQAVGRALDILPEAAWLGGDVEPSLQAFADWRNSADPPSLGTQDPLRKVMDDLAPRKSPRGRWPEAGGAWWSAPAAAGLPCTTRRLNSFAPVELVCRDDSFGEERASVWNMNVAIGARVAEIHGLTDWARLVEAYPLNVTGARRADWSRRYGWAGPWLVPDWSRLANDWDGVHVSANGYLRAQEQAAPVRDGRTVLAGWNPDATYWLRDAIGLADSVSEEWIRESGAPPNWRRVTLFFTGSRV